MRVTIDLMKKSTQIIDLSDVINPRVGDDDLLLPLHIVYGDNQTDMRGKDVEFISENTNKQRIYVGGTCNTDTPGDNLYMGNLTFRFPANTFKADGTYDSDKTMFRIVDKATNKVISSVNVKITVMKNNIEFDFDPDNTSYDSRLEEMLHGFHDKGQAMLDEIKNLNDQAKSNVSGDTAATAQEAKQQADTNAGDISGLKGEIAGARGRFADMAGREDAQDTAINQKESIVNANANYAALQQKNAQQDSVLSQKAGKYELEEKLAQMNLQPEMYADLNAVNTAYPNGTTKFIATDDGYLALYRNGQWIKGPIFQAAGIDDQHLSAINQSNPDNLVLNSDFKTTDYWTIPKEWNIDKNNNINGSNLVTITRGNVSQTTLTYIISNKMYVGNHTSVSFGWQVKATGLNYANNNAAWVELIFHDESGKAIAGSKQLYIDNNPQAVELPLYKAEGVSIPSGASYMTTSLVLSANGGLIAGRPIVNFGDKLAPYTLQQVRDEAKLINRSVEEATKNAAIQPLSNYHYAFGYKEGINFDAFDEGNHALEIKVPSDINVSWTSVDSDPIKTYGDVMSFSVRAKTPTTDGNIIAILQEFASLTDKNPVHETSLYIGGTTFGRTYSKYYAENIQLNPQTKYVVIRYSMQAHGDVFITDETLNWSASLYAHDFGELSNQLRLPQLHLNDTSHVKITDTYSTTSFSYRDGQMLINGFMKIAWQGASSRNFPKKNYKIKLFSDIECKNKLKIKLKSDWKAYDKFNLKANWIDATQARNLVNAGLFAKATAVTPFASDEVAEKLTDTQNLGQMEGFPIEVYGQGGVYMGLYTFNTKKDDKVFGMDSDDENCEAITCEQDGSRLNDPAKNVDGVAYATVVHDKASDNLKTNFTKFLTFLNTSSDDDFKAHLSDYIDVKSVMNCYLWGVLTQMWDAPAKSMILLTWDSGKTYYLTLYDMDSTWGLHFDGAYVKDESMWTFKDTSYAIKGGGCKLYERVYKLMKPELIEQYQYLRRTVWSNSQLISAFKNFINSIPKEVYEREQAAWPTIPSKGITSFAQIQSSIIKRGNAMDQFFK